MPTSKPRRAVQSNWVSSARLDVQQILRTESLDDFGRIRSRQLLGCSDLDQCVGPTARLLDRRRHVVDRRAARRTAEAPAMMGVAVDYRTHLEAVDGFAEPRRTQKWEDLRWLAFNGVLHRRIMQYHDRALTVDRAHCVLETHRFAHGLGHEILDDGFAERREHTMAKAAEKALHADEGDPVALIRLAVEYVHAGSFQDVLDLLDLTGFVIVVSEHAHDRDRAGM